LPAGSGGPTAAKASYRKASPELLRRPPGARAQAAASATERLFREPRAATSAFATLKPRHRTVPPPRPTSSAFKFIPRSRYPRSALSSSPVRRSPSKSRSPPTWCGSSAPTTPTRWRCWPGCGSGVVTRADIGDGDAGEQLARASGQARSLQVGRKDRRARRAGWHGRTSGSGPGTPGYPAGGPPSPGPACSGWTNRPCASGLVRWDTQRKRPLGSGPGSQLLAPLRRSRTALTTVSRPRRARSPALGASPRVQAIPTDIGAGAGPVSHHLAGRQADTTHPAGLDDGWACLGDGQALVISHDQLPSGTNMVPPVRVRHRDAFLLCKAPGLTVWALGSPTVLPPNHSPINI
jgi:hypothetical protein